MIRGKSTEEYIEMLERIERDHEAEERFLSDIVTQVDRALQTGDTGRFLSVRSIFETTEGRERMSRSSDLMRLRYLIGAVESEQEIGFSLFTEGVTSFRLLMDKYLEVNVLLRRIEYDLRPGAEEAFAYIRAHHVSPYAVAAILYNMISLLGHREQVLLKLTDDALNHAQYKEALGFVSVIEDPAPETMLLKQELEDAIRGGML